MSYWDDVKYISAEELEEGDTVILQVMGGVEYVDVDEVFIENGRVNWSGYNSVMGVIEDNVDVHDKVRIYLG